MSLLGELTLAFVIESIALTVVWVAMGLLAAGLVGLAFRHPIASLRDLRVPAIAGLAGAMVAGSLSHRFGAPFALLTGIGRRDVPLVWSLGGALAGALVYYAVSRRPEGAAT